MSKWVTTNSTKLKKFSYYNKKEDTKRIKNVVKLNQIKNNSLWIPFLSINKIYIKKKFWKEENELPEMKDSELEVLLCNN